MHETGQAKLIKAVLFDLDGTLLDSFTVHYAAYETMFGHFGIAITKELFLSSYSPDWYQTYRAFGLVEEHWESANALWLAEADKHVAKIFPGVRDVLVELSKTYTLGIVTSGSKIRVRRDLDRIGISHHFRTVVTGDDIHEPKPAPEGLEIALNQLSILPSEAVYIGDAHADFEMARAANVAFFGVASEFANLSHEHSEYEVYPITGLPAVLGSR
jgi:pyrophosphatase PpaX